jgi:hypothetical protein
MSPIPSLASPGGSAGLCHTSCMPRSMEEAGLSKADRLRSMEPASLAELHASVLRLMDTQAELQMAVQCNHRELLAALHGGGGPAMLTPTEAPGAVSKVAERTRASATDKRDVSCPKPTVTIDMAVEQIPSVGSCRSKYHYNMSKKKTKMGGSANMLSGEIDKDAIREIILTAEHLKDVTEDHARRRKSTPFGYWWGELKELHPAQRELVLDSFIGIVIAINALFIGLSMDLAEQGSITSVWFFIDVMFSTIFVLELAAKMFMKGCGNHFCGESRFSNCFDCFLIIIDLLQLVGFVAFPSFGDKMGDAPSASLFRIFRLLRLTRIIRLLRSPVFEDLMSMVQGMIGGMTTLVWAMVLFFIVVYVIALVFREILGRKEPDGTGQFDNVFQFFNSVPRSMFTTFRCSFGDCSTHGGMPIFEWVQQSYGVWYSFIYCAFIFIVSIGIFNVISAIFVESTMVAATQMHSAKKQRRFRDKALWSKMVSRLLRLIVERSEALGEVPERMSNMVEKVMDIDVDCKIVDEVVKEEEAIYCLGELDIDRDDHPYLSDILDPDNGGSITITDFVEGIRRLRGDPRRSDIVTVDLMVRALQVTVGEIKTKVDELHSRSRLH